MMQAELPDTYILATNKTYSIRDFINLACKFANLPIEWKGQNENETAVNTLTGKTIIRVNPKFYRPAEVDLLIGNPEKAYQKLKWKPKTSMEELCKLMMDADLERNSQVTIRTNPTTTSTHKPVKEFV